MLHFKKVLFVSALAVTLAACSGGTNNSDSSTSPSNSPEASTTPSTNSPEASASPSASQTTGSNTTAIPNAGNEQFSQQIVLLKPINSGRVGETIKVPVKVTNTSNFTWSSTPPHPVNFSYHWYDTKGNRVVLDGNRTPLTQNLAPQNSEKLNAAIKFPDTPGKYNLVLSMVQEGVAWFDIAGAPSPKIPVTVTR